MNYYDILGVNKNASEEEIKQSYRNMVKAFHPDYYKGPKEFANKKTAEINTAYEVLIDPIQRRKYDSSLENENSNRSTSFTDKSTDQSKRGSHNNEGSNYTPNHKSHTSYSKKTQRTNSSQKSRNSGVAFKNACAQFLQKEGFNNIRLTPITGNQGIDILATKKGLLYGFQCKEFTSPVGNRAVQEVLAGKVYYNCDMAVVLTNSIFTKSAEELASKSNVVLWGGIDPYQSNANTVNKKTRKQSSLFAPLSILILIGFLLFGSLKSKLTFFGKDNDSSEKAYTLQKWATDYTEIEDLDYEIKNGELTIQKYKGNSKFIKLRNTYTIGGREYPVKHISGLLFGQKKTSVILPEGQYSLDSRLIDCEYIYLPPTVEVINLGNTLDGSGIGDLKIVYFGGSPDQWDQLDTWSYRKNEYYYIIKYNVNPEELTNSDVPDISLMEEFVLTKTPLYFSRQLMLSDLSPSIEGNNIVITIKEQGLSDLAWEVKYSNNKQSIHKWDSIIELCQTVTKKIKEFGPAAQYSEVHVTIDILDEVTSECLIQVIDGISQKVIQK